MKAEHNLFNTRQTFEAGNGQRGVFYSVPQLERAGVGHSIRFGDAELDTFFPPSQWQRLASGPVALHAIDPDSDTSALLLPGYHAILRRRPA